jgi:hypothetical protein
MASKSLANRYHFSDYLRLLGFLSPILTPAYFITSQLPAKYSYPQAAAKAVLDGVVAKDATTRLLAFQLGNCYLLLGLLGVFILNTTTEIKVVRAYPWALWIADIGHVGLTVFSMGWRATLAIGDWNGVVFGNIAITLFLFASRSLYFLGYFDQNGAKAVAPKTKTSKSKGSKKAVAD